MRALACCGMANLAAGCRNDLARRGDGEVQSMVEAESAQRACLRSRRASACDGTGPALGSGSVQCLALGVRTTAHGVGVCFPDRAFGFGWACRLPASGCTSRAARTAVCARELVACVFPGAG